ncbi:MAG: hypothetical protein K6E51_05890 [Treponema sp.]|nr:hypothetical protein [Treponema sp.]
MTFPFLVLVAAHLSCKRFTPKTKGRLFFYLPSFLCGYGFYILGCILVLLSFMGAFFWFSEESHKVKIQTCYSPNKIEYCEAYHYPVGAYSGGSGRLRVYVINKFVSFLRKEVFYEPKSYIWIEDDTSDEDTSFKYVTWDTNSTIQIYPAGQSITINVHSVELYKGVILLTSIAYAIVLLIYLIIHTKV